METHVTAFHLHLHPIYAVPSSHWIIGAPLGGLHKESGVRWTPQSEPLTFTSQQKQSRGRGGTRQRAELWGTEILLMSWVVLGGGRFV